MRDRIAYDCMGRRYEFVDVWTFKQFGRPGHHALERASHSEARWVLEHMARHAPSLLDRLCRVLDGGGASMSHGSFDRPAGIDDWRLKRVTQALGLVRFGEPHGRSSDLARIHVLRPSRDRLPPAREESPERQAIDRALTRLGRGAFVFRGNAYWFARSGAGANARDFFETLSEAELVSVLRAWTADPASPAAHKDVLSELLSLAEAQRSKTGTTELLLLRRQRSYTSVLEGAGQALTPSQLQKRSERHWIEVQALDEREKPVAGVALDLVLADGEVKRLSTREDGFARVDGIPPGDVTIGLPELDGGLWRPLSGAGKSASSRSLPPTTHTVKRGDSLAKIARTKRLKNWRDVWEHPANAPLRELRKHPNRIRPGDSLTVPAARIHEIVRATNATHRIEVERFRAVVSVLNAHLISDTGSIDAHSHLPPAKLSATTSLHQDDASTTLRMNDVPEQVALDLVAPPGGTGGDGPSQEASA